MPSYNTNISKIIEKIRTKEYIIPDIQRSFVWEPLQIERLFDSLMRGFPTGTLLLWEMDKKLIKDYNLYDFFKDYNLYSKADNSKLNNRSISDKPKAVLDGQQRLTAIYIGFCGSYTFKKKWAKDIEENYHRHYLYLNLQEDRKEEYSDTEENEIEMKYEFKFKTEESVADSYWYKVSDILKHEVMHKVEPKYARIQELAQSSDGKFTNNALETLKGITTTETISYYLEEDKNIDNILEMFVRMNRGGTLLNKSDLLLSTSTAHWKSKNAREEINNLVNEINNTNIINRRKFNFNTNFVMKSCLALCKERNFKFKVENFKKKNVEDIEKNWEKIKRAIILSVDLISELGYDQTRLTSSSNVIIPITYYLYLNKIASLENISDKNKENIRRWMVHALLKGLFGSSTDNTLLAAKNAISNQSPNFPWGDLKAKFNNSKKTLNFTEDEIDILLSEKKDSKVFLLMSILFPDVVFKKDKEIEIDHIYPKTKFNKTSLKSLKMGDDEIKSCKEKMNGIANLQFLEKNVNQHEKGSRMPHEWLHGYAKEHYGGNQNKWKEENYLQDFIDKDLPKDMSGFLDFYNKRRKRMEEKLLEILEVKTTAGK